MKFKVIEQENYENYIVLVLDKELPIGWFGKKMMMNGEEINFTHGLFANYIRIFEVGDYVGKTLEIDDKQIKRCFREK